MSRLEQGLRKGARGVGVEIAYTPAATRKEILWSFGPAARAKVPVYVHVRGGGPKDEDGPAALQEVLANAYSSGAPLHVVHVTSVGAASTNTLLDMIEKAQAAGRDVTTEAYPYSASSTQLTSALFDEGFRERLGVDTVTFLFPPRASG